MINQNRLLLVVVFAVGFMGCGAGIGDVCGADAGGLHGETMCSEGTCVYDQRQYQHVCVEENLPLGSLCISDTQCGNDEQELYCQHASSDANTGKCGHALNEGDICNQLTQCGSYLFCFKELCRPPQPIGGPCFISENFQLCQDGLVCGFPNDLTLPLDDEELSHYDFTNGQCRVGGKKGEACDKSLGIGCAPDFYCKDEDNVCMELKKGG